MRLLLLALLALSLAACGDASPDAQAILETARVKHGSDRLDSARVSFVFRGTSYTAERNDGRFVYARTYADSSGTPVREGLTNDGAFREVDGTPAALTDLEARRIESAVNPVIYFALLPAALADPAVQARYLGEATVAGEPYHEVEVTFRQEGGGRDWEDRFVYWIHQDRHTMDYLAYLYATSGGGMRFRQAYNPRTVGGVRFADYHNFGYEAFETDNDAIEDYDELFEEGTLPFISDVVLDSIRVGPL